MAPQSCHHSLFLLWWRPCRISSEAFEAHAVDSQTAPLHRTYTTSLQAALSYMLPFVTPLWRDLNKVTCSLQNLFFISFFSAVLCRLFDLGNAAFRALAQHIKTPASSYNLLKPLKDPFLCLRQEIGNTEQHKQTYHQRHHLETCT